MEVNLPLELAQEILAHMHDGSSLDTPLKDLRIAFTCKAFYRLLVPLVATRQINLLGKDMGRSRLRFLDASGASLSQDCLGETGSVGVKIAEVRFTVTPFENTDSIWSLHSFLSRCEGRISSFQLILETDIRSSTDSWKPEEQDEWRRALLKLVELVMSQEELRWFEFTSSQTRWSGDSPPVQPSFESHRAFMHEGTPSKDGPSSLALSGLPYVLSINQTAQFCAQFICSQSYSSLNHLHITFSPIENTDCDGILPLLKFENVSHFSVGELTVPPRMLAAILEQNPTITSLTVSRKPTNLVPAHPWASYPRPGRTPPPVYDVFCLSTIRTLVCHPRMLLAMLRTSFSFPNLETLEVCGYDPGWGSYCHIHEVTEILVYLGQDEKPENLRPLSVKIDLPWEGSLQLREWFESASLSSKEHVKGSSIVKSLKALTGSNKSASSSSSPFQQSKPYTFMSLAVALRRLHNVTSLTLIAQKYAHHDPRPHQGNRRTWPLDVPPQLVARFIAALPAVKEVALHSIFHDLNPSNGDEGLRDIRREMGKIWKMSTTVDKISIFDYGHGELSERTEVLVRS